MTYQDLKEVLVRDVGQLGAVELGDDELFKAESTLPNSSSKQSQLRAGFDSLGISAGRSIPKTRSTRIRRPAIGAGKDTSTTREGRAYRMATAQRLDIEEGKDLVAPKDLEGRDIT